MTIHTSIPLHPKFFGESEREFLATKGFSVSTFTYSTGVAGLRIKNEVGSIEALPFQGQQIWRANFYGRELTMHSMFEEPRPTLHYLETYGAFLIHCGVTGMGAPSAQDEHAIHGELPNAQYHLAELQVGEDEVGPYISLTGTYQHTIAFSHNYIAQPKITLRRDSGRIGVEFVVTNLKHSPMHLMYLAHINFLPVSHGKIVDTVPNTKESLRVIHVFEEIYRENHQYKEMIDYFKAHPESHKSFTPEGVIDPEVVFAVTPKADRDGWALALQVLPDGHSDFVRHRPAEFKNSLRWICRSSDQRALGLLLPSTAEPSGYLAEREKGNLLKLAPGESLNFTYQCGALNVEETNLMINEIKKITEQKV